MNRNVTENQALPSGWRAVRLGDAYNISAGGDFDPATTSINQDENHPYPIYSNALTNEGLYGYSSYAKYAEDSITITARGFIGVANHRKTKFVAVGRVLVLKNKIFLSNKFVCEYINHSVRFFKETTGVPQLTAPQASKYYVTLPPLSDQKAIAFLLEKWDTVIETTESLITAKRQQFGWLVFSLIDRNKYPRRKLKDACKFVKGKKLKDGLAKEPYLEIGDIDINMKSYNLSNKQKKPSSGAVKVPKCTLLISTVRPTRGAITKTQTELYVSQAFCRLETNNDFIYYCLHQPQFLRFLESRQSGGTYPTVSHRDIMDFKIPDVPPLQQNAIAHILNTAQREIVLLEKLAEKYRTQKRGLMQKLLTGTWLLNSSLQRAKK